ncbi:hypothetical protein BK138_21620 [Paenibacillus rhizosphaerae]|uniref:Tryptophan-rich sensory protein n=2 Tax=Paenibacillus TaxID=44249 RepID=A0A1R1ELH5_9BACL|nr:MULTISPECIES: tryptophan-rich sensory protein [Paenibacillus]OMF52676.1 hypothetical protein BK138_21620 [Paenibacillus rhizosphaerae]OXL86147.1 hypothetical protein BCV73_25985 [Paenibacillus sp. SSG-1]GIO56339.1 tryptophan-rich sensory protein [Paenibacillus cineris]
MLRSNPYKWWNWLAFVAAMVVNALANTAVLGGKTTGEISDQYPTMITPEGYAFTIWSLIYVLLLGFLLYQSGRVTETRDSVRSIGPWFIISCVLNIAWLLLWQYEYIELSLVAMVLLLLSLFVIYRRTRSIYYPTSGEMWLIKLPFSLYFGWLSVAVILNIAIVLKKNGWNGFGLSELVWAVVFLLAGALIAILVSYPYRDSIYPLVFVWGYVAIALEQQDQVERAFIAALILAIILFVYAIYLFFARSRDRD